MRTRTVTVVLTAALLLGGLSQAQAGSKPQMLSPPDGAVSIRPGDSDYRIGPQDVLDINVFQVSDLTKTVQVDTGGKILLPLIGQMTAAGRTPGELSADIATSLQKAYMRDPQVVVSVKEASSQKITVDGAVAQPGIYALQGPTTLMQAVALAHGIDPKLANLRKVAVIRIVGRKRTAGMFDLAAIREGRADDPQIYGQDVIIVDTSGGKSFLNNFSQAFPLLSIVPFL
jgi:polysaccharide export outer membrane protein